MVKQKTETQKAARLQKRREQYRAKREKETSEEREKRLAKTRQAKKDKKVNDPILHEEKLKIRRQEYATNESKRQKNRAYVQHMRTNETQSQKEERLQKQREYDRHKKANETQNQKELRLQKKRNKITKETPSQREKRLSKSKEYDRNKKANETEPQKEARLEYLRKYSQNKTANESETERSQRLSICSFNSQLIRLMEEEEAKELRLQADREKYKAMHAKIEVFHEAINVFADQQCQICTKKCYPNQIVKYFITESPPIYLPNELKSKAFLMVCHTCKSHLTDKKKLVHPPKAYWNRLDPGPIPDCIKALTKAEIGLLSRIHPYIKVIKYDGRFGQNGFKGLATLFAKDIFEVTEKVDSLPRATNDSNIIIVTEELENLDITKEYKIDRTRLFTALDWLIKNNPLYKDVKINEDVNLNENDLVRKAQEYDPNTDKNPQQNQPCAQEHPPQENQNFFLPISDSSRIIRASFNQGEAIFDSGFEGRQCCSMALAAIVRAKLNPPIHWNTTILNEILMNGDDFYSSIRVPNFCVQNFVALKILLEA